MKAADSIFIFSKKIGKKIDLDLPYFVKNGFWMTIRQTITALSGLAISIAFARLSAQEVLGQYQFILSVLSVVSILSIPGLNTSIIQSVARGYEGNYKNAVKISLIWSFLGIPVLLAIGSYYYFLGNHVLGMAFMISSIFFPFFYAPNTWDSFLQGKKRFDISTKFVSVQAIFNALVTVVVIYFSKNNLLPIMVFYLFSFTSFNIYYYYKTLRFIGNDKKDPDAVRYGFFLTKVTFLGVIAENLDKIIVGILISPESLAIYYVVSFLPIKIKEFFKPFLSLLLLKFSTIDQSISQMIKQKKRLVSLLVFVIIAGGASYYFLIERINLIAFGEKYQPYYHYSKYYFILILLSIPLLVLSRYALGVKDNKTIMLTYVAYPIIRTFISLALIYKYSIAGAIVAYNINTILLFSLYAIGIRISNKEKKPFPPENEVV